MDIQCEKIKLEMVEKKYDVKSQEKWVKDRLLSKYDNYRKSYNRKNHQIITKIPISPMPQDHQRK